MSNIYKARDSKSIYQPPTAGFSTHSAKSSTSINNESVSSAKTSNSSVSSEPQSTKPSQEFLGQGIGTRLNTIA
jgi:hypothetical protein